MAVDWSANSSFSAAKGLPYEFVQGETSLFLTTEIICITVHGVQHRVSLLFITATFWRRTHLPRGSAQSPATALLNGCHTSGKPSPSFVEIIEPTIIYTITFTSNLLPACVSLIFSVESFYLDFPILPSHDFLITTPSATVAASQPLANVLLNLFGLLKSASFILTSSVFPPMSSFVPFSFAMIFSSPPVTSFAQKHSAVAAHSSVQPPVTPKPAASSSPLRGPVIALLRRRPTCQNAEIAQLVELFLARENRV